MGDWIPDQDDDFFDGIARYISTRGEPGPWGNLTPGTVPRL